MARASGAPQRAFSGGEQSPLLGARADLARWQSSLEICENAITLMQGGLTRRSGFQDVYQAQDNSVMLEFAFSGDDGYAIEFAPNPGYLRFFRDFGILLKDDLSGPYQVESPFSLSDVSALSPAQTAQWMFLACGSRPIQQVTRVSNTNWTIGNAAIKNGPFLTTNLDQTLSLSTTATGELTAGKAGIPITATQPIFNVLHVGALFRIRIQDDSKHGLWCNGVRQTVGDIVLWDGNWYKCSATFGTGGTGTNPPVHLYGKAWDGPIVGDDVSAVQWQYLHSGFGIAQITGFTDAQNVTATAVTYIPDDLETGTWRFEEGAWSDYRGYPALIGFHKRRLWAASTTANPTRVWAGVIDDYTNYDDSTSDDEKAFSFDLEADSGEVNFPQWLLSGSKMAIGTSHNEFVVGSADVTSPITPTSVDPQSDTNEGSASVRAVKVDNPVFVSKNGKRVHELAYDLSQQKYVTPDLTSEADHISGSGDTGITRIEWLRDPYRLLFGTRSDGELISAVYRKDQNVIGWHRHPMAGDVLDICRAPSPTGIRQDLWAKIQYMLPSGTVTRIQSLRPFFETGDLTPASAWFSDCSFQYSGAATSIVNNIPGFMIGTQVIVRADGEERAALVVTPVGDGTGQITLDRPGALVTLGLPFLTRIRTLRYDQRLQGRNAKVSAVTLDVIRSGPVYACAPPLDLELLVGAGDQPVDTAAALTTGLLDVPLGGNWSDDGNVEIQVQHTGPLTIRALTPHTLVAS